MQNFSFLRYILKTNFSTPQGKWGFCSILDLTKKNILDKWDLTIEGLTVYFVSWQLHLTRVYCVITLKQFWFWLSKIFYRGNIHDFFYFFLSDTEGKWVEEDTLDAHSDWVRDVAFATSCGQENIILASCSLVSEKLPKNDINIIKLSYIVKDRIFFFFLKNIFCKFICDLNTKVIYLQ